MNKRRNELREKINKIKSEICKKANDGREIKTGVGTGLKNIKKKEEECWDG